MVAGFLAKGQKIGKRILFLRQAAGLSQKELAERAGILPSRLSNIEAGRVNPNVEAVIKIASALGISSDLILGLELDNRTMCPLCQGRGSLEPVLVKEVESGKALRESML